MKKYFFQNRIILLFYTILVCAIFFVFIGQVNALSISPLRHTLVMDRGESNTIAITVTNEEDKTQYIQPDIDGFSIDPEKGYAVFNVKDEAISWIKTKEGIIELEPNQTKDILFNLEIPNDALPGAHYLGLFAKKTNTENEGVVSIGSRVGSLLFLYVSGEIQESLFRETFQTKKNININPNIDVNIELKNNGNIHVVPVGNLVIRNRKNKILETKNLNDSQQKIFPNNNFIKTFTFSNLNWKDAGKINIEMSLKYGLQEQEIHENISVWFIPKAVIVFALIIIGSIFIIFMSIMIALRR